MKGIILLIMGAIITSLDMNAQSNIDTDDIPVVNYEYLMTTGLPSDVLPAKYYFQKGESVLNPWTGSQIQESSLGDNYFFFIRETRKTVYDDPNAPLIELWVYNLTTRKSNIIFTQSENVLGGQDFYSIDWAFFNVSHDSLFINQGTKERLRTVTKDFFPVIVLSAREDNPSPHSPYFTDVINLKTNRYSVLKGHKFVSIAEPVEAPLLSAEQEEVNHYIITTSTEYQTIEEPIKSLTNKEFDLYPEHIDTFSRNYLTTRINAVSADGKIISSAELPKEEIDELR